jgi:hypothetical protein
MSDVFQRPGIFSWWELMPPDVDGRSHCAGREEASW